jgi:hypothetical protein
MKDEMLPTEDTDDKFASLAAAEVAKKLEQTQVGKYHTKGGHGFAAEDANAFVDTVHFRKVEVTGPTNKVNGPDRIVNGIAIQTKYFQTPRATIEAAFDDANGLYRYHGQVLEVPKDQYDECVRIVQEKIAQGKVPGVTDPNEAHKIVKQGYVTYKQARNIARAGNIDSLLFDIKTQVVTSGYIFAISFAVDYARRKWNGDKTEDAIKGAIQSGVVSGSTTLITGVLAAQVLRTRTAMVGAIAIRSGVRSISSTSLGRAAVQKVATASLGKAVYGAAAANHVAKLLRSNVVTSTIAIAVMTAPDFYRVAIARNISWPQFTKNLIVNTSGVATGIGGWLAGAAAGATVGSAVPVIGTAVGGIVGGLVGALLGGTVGTIGAKAVLDKLVEDDAKRMISLLQSAIEELAHDYLLSEQEIEEFAIVVKQQVSEKWLREMYHTGSAGNSDDNRRSFAYNYFDEICQRIAAKRPKVTLPNPSDVLTQIDKIAEDISTSEDFAPENVSITAEGG